MEMESSLSSESFVLVNPPPSSTSDFFPSPPSSLQLDSIYAARSAQPDRSLFIDHLLSLALPHATPSSLYPPSSHDALLDLVATLESSTASTLTARSGLYYLALVFNPLSALNLAQQHLLLPAPFRLSVRAFHALDTANYALGVKLLADPRVTPDFIPRTFAILDSLPPPDERSRLVLSYWRLAAINLDDHGKDEVKVVVRALCGPARKSGANEAWNLIRAWKNDEDKDELYRTALATCFGDNPTRLPLAPHLSTLLSSPFTASESALASSFCASPPGNLSKTLVADWLLSKLIAESRPVDALPFWNSVKNRVGVEASEQRDRLLVAVEANLTSAQKTSLSLELLSLSSTTAAAAAPPSSYSSAVTQPAWAPTPVPALPVVPTPLPRTLAAARALHLPPPAAPSPSASDLPLSASPFIRGGASTNTGAGAGGVLRALEVAQQTPRRTSAGAAVASPAKFGSPFAFAANSTAAPRQAPSATAPSSVAGSVSAASIASPVKPTLSGFGSVRQLPQQQQQQQQQQTPKPRRIVEYAPTPVLETADEDGEDEEMGDASASTPAAQQPPAAATEDFAFALRAAQDPAIAATIAAASRPRPSASTSASAAVKRSRSSNGAAARERAKGRGDKRRAVSVEPADGGKEEEVGSVRLPPGAFPTEEEEEEAAEREKEDAKQKHKKEEKKKEEKRPSRTPAKPKSSAPPPPPPPSTARRRSTRQSTVEAESQAGSDTEEPQQKEAGRRRSTRASSVAPSVAEVSEVEEEEQEEEGRRRRSTRRSTAATPARRSSRKGGKEDEEEAGEERRTVRRSTRATRGRIEEQEEE